MVAETEDGEDESLRIDCPVLVTERLVLRSPHEDDVPDLAKLANNRRVAEMLARMPHPYGSREARAFIDMAKAHRIRRVPMVGLLVTGSYPKAPERSGKFEGSGFGGTIGGWSATIDVMNPGIWRRSRPAPAAHKSLDTCEAVARLCG